MPRFAAPAAYGFPRRRGFQHFDGRRVPRLTRSLSECWKPRQVSSRFRQVEGFSALSMAGGFLARPAGCWKGGKAAPESPFPQRPRAFTPPAGRLPKSKEKGHPPGCPSSFTDRTPPDSGYGLLALTSCCGGGAFPSGSRTPYPQGRRTTRRPP